MRRQLRASGGITNARQGYGIGSWVKERIRKIIPNELASVASKAAPVVAMFNPAIGGLMRGIGRFDKTGSMSDALKQGIGTYAGGKVFGKGMETFAGRTPGGSAIKSLKELPGKFMEKGSDIVSKGIKTLGKSGTAGEILKGQLLVGGGTAIASFIASQFAEDPQQSGESFSQYMARRRPVVEKNLKMYLGQSNPGMSQADLDRLVQQNLAEYTQESYRTSNNQGGRVGLANGSGGISMTNTAAQNRAINNAQRAQNQEQLQKGRDVQKATQELDSYFGKGSSTSNPNRQAFITKNFNSMPVQSAAGFNFSGAISDPFNVMSYDSKNRAGIINTIASNYAQERRNQAAPTTSTFNKQASIDAAAAREAKAKAYYQALEQKQIEAYGRGVKTLPELFGGDAYKAEAATLGGMNPGAYMDYLLTGDPQDIMYKYNQSVDGIQNPNYDPEFASYEDMYGTNPRNPYDIYYQNQLQRQIDQGIPEAERIQKGQVLGLPGMLPTSGTTPNIYESYEDALARTKRDMGLNQGGRVGYNDGTNPKKEFLIKQGYGDMVKGMSVIEIDQLFNSVKGTFTDAGTYRQPQNMGGIMRAGYAMGTPLPNDPTKPINPFGPKPTGPVLPSNDKMADARSQLLMQRIEELMDEGLDYNAARAQAEREVSSKNMGGLMRTGYANGSEEFQSYLKGRQKFEKEMSLEEYYKDFLRMKKDKRIAEEKTMAADGGLMRLNYMIGGEAKQMEAGAPPIIYEGNMDPNAQAGLPSVPGPMQMAEDGPEFDMRENGGFQPLGRQEGKDDVPAMLAKNEFVMTADAVRAAGGGSIQKGAQKMYDTMKKLESRVS